MDFIAEKISRGRGRGICFSQTDGFPLTVTHSVWLSYST